jgi:hypothetical protein
MMYSLIHHHCNIYLQFIISRPPWSSGHISPGSKGWLDSCIRLWSMTKSWGSIILFLNRISNSPLKAFILCDTSSKFATTILGSPGYICGSFSNPWTLLLRYCNIFSLCINQFFLS